MAEIIIKEAGLSTAVLKQKLSALDELLRDNKFTTRADGSRNDLVSALSLEIQSLLSSLADSETMQIAANINYGTPNSSRHYNAFWTAVKEDLYALYSEADRLGNVLSDNHNYVMSDIQNLLLQLKSANARLATYELYASSKVPNRRDLAENFNDISHIDLNSSLLGGLQCNIDTVQGIITLAVSRDIPLKKTDIASVTIASANSNGVEYNNTSLLQAINSGDFYLFQYEHTSPTLDTYKLVLDFTVKLSKSQIINHIRIVPNNFGTTTWPTITALDVSEDGLSLFSVRDSLLGENSTDTQFVLAPYTSNYAGEGRYSFLPQRAQYVHFTIQQTTPYFDAIRNLYRWAIGIKNIEITGRVYEDGCQLISKDYTINQGIASVAIDADELPSLIYAEQELASEASILHDISIDSGMTWKAIAPKYLSTQDTGMPEIIYINSVDGDGATEGASHLNTSLQKNTLRYRIRMARNADKFTDTDLIPYYTPILRKLTLSVISPEVV